MEFLSSSIPEKVCASRIWNPLKSLPEEDKRSGNHRGNTPSELVSFVSNRGHWIPMYRILFENWQKRCLSLKGDPLWEKSAVPGLCGAYLCRTPPERPALSLRLWAAVFSHSTARQCVRATSLLPGEWKPSPPIPSPYTWVWVTHAPNFLGLFRETEDPLKGDGEFSAVKVGGNFSSELGQIEEMWLCLFPTLGQHRLLDRNGRSLAVLVAHRGTEECTELTIFVILQLVIREMLVYVETFYYI